MVLEHSSWGKGDASPELWPGPPNLPVDNESGTHRWPDHSCPNSGICGEQKQHLNCNPNPAAPPDSQLLADPRAAWYLPQGRQATFVSAGGGSLYLSCCGKGPEEVPSHGELTSSQGLWTTLNPPCHWKDLPLTELTSVPGDNVLPVPNWPQLCPGPHRIGCPAILMMSTAFSSSGGPALISTTEFFLEGLRKNMVSILLIFSPLWSNRSIDSTAVFNKLLLTTYCVQSPGATLVNKFNITHTLLLNA